MVDNLLLRRPKSQSRNSEVRGKSVLVERVTPPDKGQCQQEPGIEAPHSLGTRVTMPGTPYISVSLSGPQENLDFVPSVSGGFQPVTSFKYWGFRYYLGGEAKPGYNPYLNPLFCY